jgi:hypothetical protein
LRFIVWSFRKGQTPVHPGPGQGGNVTSELRIANNNEGTGFWYLIKVGKSLCLRVPVMHQPVLALERVFSRGVTPMSTWTEDDKRLAERALNTLEVARSASHGAAFHSLEPVRRKMGDIGPEDIPERVDAWLAVCSLCQTLAEDPDSEELVFQWQDAIDSTRAWLEAMR